MAIPHETQITTHNHIHTLFDPLTLSIALAAFSLLTYFLCIALSLALPAMEASMKLLYPALFPGFVWLTASSVVWGAVFLLIAALYVGSGFALVYNFVSRLLRA